MRRLLALLLILLLSSACGAEGESGPYESYTTFPFTHYASGSTIEEYQAVILFEQANETFTAYQVSYPSCTCRDPMSNTNMVAYVEILNSREDPNTAAIRKITFGENKGLWGDSNPNYFIAEYTEEYYDENLVQPLVGLTKGEVDEWEGYGTHVSLLTPDALAGATVSSSNLQSMLRSLMDYHVYNYYGAE